MTAARLHALDSCQRCGLPADVLAFDASSVVEWPISAREVVLARFDLPSQYCGVLDSFFQFTSEHASDASRIATPTIQWRLLVDRHPVAPYPDLRWIVNPWGAFKPNTAIRLSPGARVELVARRLPGVEANTHVAGRITGHYWYDASYGALRPDHHG